jgi:hypothetical protein
MRTILRSIRDLPVVVLRISAGSAQHWTFLRRTRREK